MGVDRFAFTSDQLTPGLTDRQRFSAWIELYNDNFGVRGDFEASSAPFQAHMEFAWVGDLILARADLTAAAGEFGGRHRATPEDEGRMGIMINTSGHAIQTKHRGREDALAPGGSMLLCRADEGRFWLGSNSASSWVLIDMPRPAVKRAAPNSEDLVGGVLSGGGEALRLASAYAALVFQEPGFADQRLDAHVSQTFFDLLALVLGAEKETAEIARGRGLRAARLDAIVQGIAKGYADPSFSVATVATRLNLSERYIQDLLRSTGVGFSERVMELRLQHSVGLLARAHLTRQKISEVALSSGFNDLSYFHRCFRRRFGMTPATARA